MGKLFYSLLILVTILKKTHESCGVQRTSYNLMENEVSSGEFPWHVFLKPNSGRLCSGTILGEFWILSSAKCFTEMTTTILMKAGELNLNFQGKVYTIRKLIRHADYNEESVDNTLALLETSEPIVFNDMVLPACYPSDILLDANHLANCWVTAIKERSQDGPESTAGILKKIQMISIQPCGLKNMSNLICASASNVENTDCMVTSGDALMCQYRRNKGWAVVGIAAAEKAECSTTTVLFARTASYITWLKESTENEGKPIIPVIYPTEQTSNKKDIVNYTVYYNEEFPPIEDNPEFRQNPNNQEIKSEAGKISAISAFYTFLVILTT